MMPHEVDVALANPILPVRPLDQSFLSSRVAATLAEFLDGQRKQLCGISTDLDDVARAISDFVLTGGKRLRPAFAYWGWRGTGAADCDEIVRASSCLELLHGGALIHDDVMDGSDIRRGHAAVHRRFAALHSNRSWQGSSETFGVASAILIGNLCLVWTDELLTNSGMSPTALDQVAPIYHAMRMEVMAGQYLDLLGQAHQRQSISDAFRVVHYKSAKYTVERPLHFGARLAGGNDDLLAHYSAYGLPLGEAFQLRDDILGVFGDSAMTGKPSGDDLREGKRTVLVTFADQRANTTQRAFLRQLLGNRYLDDDDIARLREVIVDSGALHAVEQLIDERRTQALSALVGAPIDDGARDALVALATAATTRQV